MRKLQKQIADWQRKTFGKNTAHISGMTKHLLKEVIEIREATLDIDTQSKNPIEYVEKIQNELADVIILTAGLADAYGIDLEDAVKDKMNVNKKRKWKQPDQDGVIEHEDE